MISKAKQNFTPKDVGKLAEMAGLEMEDNRLEALTARYSGFLNELEKLRELDITDQEPVFVFKAEESLS